MDYALSKRWEVWVQILTGRGWIAVGGDEGIFAFLLAAVPGGLLVTGKGKQEGRYEGKKVKKV